uniref:Uncharacterized protein n=1 Tax=viral metagenome TaxID=1070528 RepID=A0A6C0IUJ3_9ZZZZ
MNANIARLRQNGNGDSKLFDVNGNSSLGSLPQGRLQVKPEFIASMPSEDPNFSIGGFKRSRVFDVETKNHVFLDQKLENPV